MKLNRAQCVLGCVRDGRDAGSASSHLKATAEMTLTHAPKLTTDGDRSIGSRIAAYRTAQRLSQTALAQALGVTFQQVQKYEKGRNRVGAARLQAIADFLGVSVSTFFDDPAENTDGKESIQNLLQDPDVMELVAPQRALHRQGCCQLADGIRRRPELTMTRGAGSVRSQAPCLLALTRSRVRALSRSNWRGVIAPASTRRASCVR